MRKFAAFTLLLLAIGLSSLAIWQTKQAHETVFRISSERIGDIHFTKDVEGLSLKLAAQFNNWRESGEVPEILPDEMPPGVLSAEHPRQWKRRFLASLTPIILKMDDLILEDRARLQHILAKREKGRKLKSWESAWLNRLAAHYGVMSDDAQGLLRRVDAIPPSLALAQAAIESAWGRSRFAADGNALFGQWTWKSRGLVPAARPEGANHKVRSFDNLAKSVEAYFHNLNTHRAYRDFRRVRERQRKAGEALDSNALADTLLNYSERGEVYPQEIRTVIRANRLKDFDDAVLLKPHSAAF